jgi:hypothetical protein
MITYHIFNKLEQILLAGDLPQHGIRMIMAKIFFDENVQDMPGPLQKLLEIVSSEVRSTCPLRSVQQQR